MTLLPLQLALLGIAKNNLIIAGADPASKVKGERLQ